MGLSAAKTLRSLFTALAVATGAVTVAASPALAYYSYGTGSASNGSERHYKIHLKDEQGEPMEFVLPMPDQNLAAFQQAAIDVLKDYITIKNMNLSDRDASSFVWMIGQLAEDAAMRKNDFLAAINLELSTYQQFEYQSYRNGVMEEYNSVLEASQPNDWHNPDFGVTYGDEKIKEINEKLAEAAAKYPDEPAFRARPLIADDLRNIRVFVATLYVDKGLRFLEALDRGESGKDSREIDEMLSFIYRDNPYYEDANPYNRELAGLMDVELKRRGCSDQCRDDFYVRLIKFHNFHDRVDTFAPVPPAIAVPKP